MAFSVCESRSTGLEHPPCLSSSAYERSVSVFYFPRSVVNARRGSTRLKYAGVRVKNDWFCLIRGRERETVRRASANCDMQEFNEAFPSVRSASQNHGVVTVIAKPLPNACARRSAVDHLVGRSWNFWGNRAVEIFSTWD